MQSLCQSTEGKLPSDSGINLKGRMEQLEDIELTNSDDEMVLQGDVQDPCYLVQEPYLGKFELSYQE
jgi:hypothetical protein